MRSDSRQNALTEHEFTYRESFTERQKFKLDTEQCEFSKVIVDRVPITQWIIEYDFKRDLIMDFIAGVTVTVLHVPQGIAYAFLANVPSVCGLYTPIFTSFIYVIFGTAKNINFGTFSVVCLITGEIVNKYTIFDENGVELEQHADADVIGGEFKNIEVLSAATFMAGIYLIMMHIFRLGCLTSLLSNTLTNAFTCGAATHLIVSQLKDFFGITLKRRENHLFYVGFTIYDISKNMPKANYVSTILSSTCLLILVVHNECIKPLVAKKCRFPIPMEMLVVAFGVLLSYWIDLNGKFNLQIIGKIPTGLPASMVPKFSLFHIIAIDCIPLALVSYIITMSLCKIFSKLGSYEVRANQELLAMGLMNLFGSLFQCIPVSGSLSRSGVQHHVGGVSEIAMLVSSILILFVLLYIAPLMEILPRGVLAAITISSIYSMLRQIRDLKKFWLLSKLDAMIWIITFSSTILIDVQFGLYFGIIAAVLVVCCHFCRPNSYVLGVVPRTEIYMSTQRYKEVEEIEGIKIFRYNGGMNFTTVEIYKDCLAKNTGINTKRIINERNQLSRRLQPGEMLPELVLPVKCIILDFSALSHIDPTGIDCLMNIEIDNKAIGITVLISGASGEICEQLANYDKVEKKGHEFTIFVTVHDAVMYAKKYVLK